MKLEIFISSAFFVLIFACQNGGQQKKVVEGQSMHKMKAVQIDTFGSYDGIEVMKYRLFGKERAYVDILNFGGIIQSILVPDQNGRLTDVVLGFDNFEDYLKPHPYFGAIIGRYGNRIANGAFQIDGQEYAMVKNNGPNHLHGGTKGFDKVLWDVSVDDSNNEAMIHLSYLSKDGEEGYPGNLDATVSYSFTQNNELIIKYKASTDAKTHINLTNHSYFNLNGEGSGSIEKHLLQLNAGHITSVNSSLIPDGILMPVHETPFDFRKERAIGLGIDDDDQQVIYGGGYDHNFVLEQSSMNTPFATALGNVSKIEMKVYTDEPGVQFYTGNFMDGSTIGKSGEEHQKRSGFCLETQHFPDSPNQPNFPSTLLEPGALYESTTVYQFGVR